MDGAPQTVKEGVTKAEAEEIKAKLEEQGAVVEAEVGRSPILSRIGAAGPGQRRSRRLATYFSETNDTLDALGSSRICRAP